MLLELLNHAFLDSTFFYLSLGLIFITFGVMYFNHLYNKHFFASDSLFRNKHQYTKININHLEKPLIINGSFIVWFIITFKRIDEKDDKEDNSISYFKSEFKIRGGERWNKIAYLQPYKNIKLLF